MDALVAAFGTALVAAVATDAWGQVREAITALWHRVRTQHDSDGFGTELDELREKAMQARRDGDAAIVTALEGTWQLKVLDLLRADPALATELRRVLDEILTPALAPAEQARVGTIIMTGSSHDSSTFTQIGTQTIYGQP
jgi:hypothetical protein